MNRNIKIDSLNWSYGQKKILEKLCLDTDGKKITVIAGPNGSGKTTLLKCMMKILNPGKNTVFIDDTDIKDLPFKDLAKITAHVPQHNQTNFNYSVEDIVMMGRYPHLKRFQQFTNNDYKIVEEAMEATGIIQYRNNSINELSGGEAQRVIISRALAQKPKILFMDEPTTHLDLLHQIEIMNLVKKLSLEMDISIIIILHDLNYAFQYSDNLILLDNGKIVGSGIPDSVLTEKVIQEVYQVKVNIIETKPGGKKFMIPDFN